MNEKVLTLRNSRVEIARIAGEIEAHAAARGWPDDWAFKLNLALDELLVNIVNHGYEDLAEHEIRIVLREEEGRLRAVVEDDGVAFDPFADAPAPDLAADLEARAVGGLGVHLVKSVMDEVGYERRDGRNFVELVLHRAQEAAQEDAA